MGELTRLVVVAAALAAAAGAARLRAAPPEGCYRFDRPLGHSATGERERADSSWYAVELRPGGTVARPRLASAYWRAQYARRSSWRASGDTLYIRVFTGLVGWDVALAPEGVQAGRYVGSALYLTDAIVAGAEPLRVPLRAARSLPGGAPCLTSRS